MKKLIVILMFLFSFVSAIAETVYITKTGKRYHFTKECSGLARAKKIIPIEKVEAEKRGYTLCKKESSHHFD